MAIISSKLFPFLAASAIACCKVKFKSWVPIFLLMNSVTIKSLAGEYTFDIKEKRNSIVS